MFTQNILIPTDFSNASLIALEAGAILAKTFNARVTLAHVANPSPPDEGAENFPDAPRHAPLPPDWQDRLHTGLQKIRDERLKDLSDVRVTLILSINPADGIVHYAQKENIDLIVMSTHGRTGLAHLLIGSVAERVVRHAHCPVLTLRSKVK